MIIRRILFCLLLVLGLAACEPPPPEGLRFGLASAPLTLDPRYATDAAGERIARLLFARLTDHDTQGRAIPSLADWQQLDATHYRLTLRATRASFADGQRLTSTDVVATYRAIMNPQVGSPHRETLRVIRAVTAINAEQILFELNQPDAMLPGRLDLGILPAAQANALQRLALPIGSGPFQLISQDSQGVRLQRRRDGMPLLLLPVSDPTVRALKLLRGEVDIIQNDLPPEIAAWLAQQPHITVIRGAGDTFSYLGFNLDDPATGQHVIRQAIAHAIDRQALISHLFHDGASLAESVLTPEHWAGHPALLPVNHDPARARQLLASVGYDQQHPLPLVYKTSADPFRLRLAAAIQAQLAAVGIAVDIQSYDWGTFYGDIKAGRFQLYSLSWVGIKEPDILRHIFHSTALPPDGANRNHYASPLVDLALDAAGRATTVEAMADAYRTVQEQVHDDLVYAPLWYEQQWAAYGPRVSGYTLRRDGAYDALTTVRIKPSAQVPR